MVDKFTNIDRYLPFNKEIKIDKKVPAKFENIFKNKETKSFDSKITTSFLLSLKNESNINRRLDDFIRDTLRNSVRENQRFSDTLRHLQDPSIRLPRQPDLTVPARPTEQNATTKKSFWSRFGLAAQSSEHIISSRNVIADGQPILRNGDRYTRVDFTPGQRTALDPSKLTESLANGIKGLTELVAAIDKGEVELEPVFAGYTNINMAQVCQRMGFKISDEHKTEDGKVDTSQNRFYVVGKLEDIKRKLAEFAQSGLDQRVIERDTRLKQRLQPA